MQVWTFLLPILAVDVVNPVLFAFMVYAAGGARPALTSGAMLGGRSKGILARINGWLERVGNVLMPLMIGALGLALVADAVSYFVRGQGLW